MGQIRLSSGQTHHSNPVKVAAAQNAYNEIKLEFPWGNGVLLGTVTTEAGQPLARATIIKYLGNYSIGGRAQVVTDQNGKFRLDGIEKGATEVRVYYPLSYDNIAVHLDLEERETAVTIKYPSIATTVSCSNIPRNMVRLSVVAYEPNWKPDYRGDYIKATLRDKGHFIAQARYFPEQGTCRLFGLAPNTYVVSASSYPCDVGSVPYFNEKQLNQFLNETRVVVKEVTVTSANPNPSVNLDFADSVSLFELTQGVTPK